MREVGRYCVEYSTGFDNLLDAKEECTQNLQCTMLYDDCGNGNSFRPCNSKVISKSVCNSILYRKGATGKLVQLIVIDLVSTLFVKTKCY